MIKKQLYASDLELKFAKKYDLEKNTFQFLIWDGATIYKKPITKHYTPDFIIDFVPFDYSEPFFDDSDFNNDMDDDITLWIDVKGFPHKSYLERRPLILDYCRKNNIIYLEAYYNKKNKDFICCFPNNRKKFSFEVIRELMEYGQDKWYYADEPHKWIPKLQKELKKITKEK